ncbi:MAG: hypothetical protein ACRD7E_32955, partial [Bryobacteraceae bacterium]
MSPFISYNVASQSRNKRQVARHAAVKLERVEEEVVGKAYDSRLMRRLLTYMRPYKRTVAVSLV